MLSVASRLIISCKPIAIAPQRLAEGTASLVAKRSLSYLPHQFSEDEAAKRFAEEDRKRLFAPLPRIDQTEGLIPHVNPIKKALIPVFAVTVDIRKTEFEGEYGKNRSVVYTGGDGKIHTRIHTDWYDISGTLGPKKYGTMVYGGLSWDAGLMEQAVEDFNSHGELKELDPKSVDSNTVIDPFLIRGEIAQETAMRRIESSEKDRASKYIEKKKWCDHTHVDRISIDFNTFECSSFLLPAYILQYQNTPPRIMPAFNHEVKIIGPAPLSLTKVMAASGAAGAALSFLFPQAALTSRAIAILASSLSGGFFAQYKLYLQHFFQQNRMERAARENERVSESGADKKRREATTSTSENDQMMTLNIDPKHFQAIGLDPMQPVNEEAIRAAFNEKIQRVHPDHNREGGSTEQTKQLLEARKAILDALKEEKKPGYRTALFFYDAEAGKGASPQHLSSRGKKAY